MGFDSKGTINSCTLIGRLGKDPVEKVTKQGKRYILISIGTVEDYTDENGNRKDDTTWHQVVVRGQNCDFVSKYIKKGDRVRVEGKVSTRSWKENDEWKYYTNIESRIVQPMDTKRSNNESSAAPESEDAPLPIEEDMF